MIFLRLLPVNALEAFARPVWFSLENPLLVRRPEVAEGDKVEIIGIVLTHQDAAFVPGADQARFHRLAGQSSIPVINGSRDRQHGTRREQALHEIAPGKAVLPHHALEICFADLSLFGRHIQSH